MHRNPRGKTNKAERTKFQSWKPIKIQSIDQEKIHSRPYLINILEIYLEKIG